MHLVVFRCRDRISLDGNSLSSETQAKKPKKCVAQNVCDASFLGM
jgi:hypothetical protein